MYLLCQLSVLLFLLFINSNFSLLIMLQLRSQTPQGLIIRQKSHLKSKGVTASRVGLSVMNIEQGYQNASRHHVCVIRKAKCVLAFLVEIIFKKKNTGRVGTHLRKESASKIWLMGLV